MLDLSPDQWRVVQQACALYQAAAPVIRDGRSVLHGDVATTWRQPRGWQAVVRHDAERALVVLHTYAEGPDHVEIDLPPGRWAVEGTLPATATTAAATGSVEISGLRPWQGQVLLLSASAS